jgi:ATP-binding cassette subfamily C protein
MRLVAFFARAYPWQSLAMVVCLLLAAVSEAVGLSTLLPVLGLATEASAETGAPPPNPSPLESGIRQVLGAVGITPSLAGLIPVVIAAFWLKAVLVLLAKRQVGYTVAHVAADMRLELLRSLLSARWSYYTRQPLGAVANAMTTEAERTARSYHFVSQLVAEVIETLLYAGIALAVSWQAALGAVLGGAFTLATLNALVRRGNRAGVHQTWVLKSLLSRLTDTLQAVRMLKATGREGLVGPLLEADTQRLNRTQQKLVFSKEALMALQEPILMTIVLAGLFVAVAYWQMAIASVMVLVLVFTRALNSLNKVQRKYQIAMAEASAVWSLVELIERARSQREESHGTHPPHLERGIRLEGVGVSYDDRPVLRDLDIEIPAGELTLLVGPSGAGKSTIADLVTGLVRPDVGRVSIDGLSLDEIDIGAWRRQIGYVPQDLPMLHDSVRTNVTLGQANVSDAEVERALREASAWDFVSAMPDGMDSSVGERGTLLSGGQRQRIAVARALLHEPQLLVLDEATAALDAEAAASVWRAVQKLRGKTTILAITHQLGLVASADRAYRIEDGRAVRVATTSSPGSSGAPRVAAAAERS